MNERRPGQWPVTDPVDLDMVHERTVDELYVQRAAERARHEIALASIRAHLEEQPTANAVQSVARSWLSDLTAVADEVARAKRSAA